MTRRCGLSAAGSRGRWQKRFAGESARRSLVRPPVDILTPLTRPAEENDMRKLILRMQISLDGFVSGPEGEVRWIFDSMDDGLTRWTVGTVSRAGLHIMGSRTFSDMAAYWPTSDEPIAAPMNLIPKMVFSRKGGAR